MEPWTVLLSIIGGSIMGVLPVTLFNYMWLNYGRGIADAVKPRYHNYTGALEPRDRRTNLAGVQAALYERGWRKGTRRRQLNSVKQELKRRARES